MTELRQSSAPRPITPQQQGRSTSSQFLSAPRQPLPIQTSNTRPISGVGPLSPVNQNGSFAFDRVIKRGKVERRVKKKGAWKASWKPAYLVLRPNLLSVYRDSDETELRASITLSDVTAVAPVKKSHHENVFGVFSPAKNHHFSTIGARDTSDWIAILRLEARTEEQSDLQPPNASFQQGDNVGYDTTDMSADEELHAPASPEVPQWAVKGQKNRVLPQASVDPRKSSAVPYPSGNESFATSQSDFSDGFGSSVPNSKGYLSTSVPIQPSTLAPIPDDVPTSPIRPGIDRNASHLSDIGTLTQHVSKSTPKAQPVQSHQDPSRVIRQGHLKLAKTTSGVKQWKSIWMVLRAPALSIYKSNNEYTPVIVIPIYNLIEAAEIDRRNKPNCFQIIGEEKTYRLQAESENELESWLGAFKSVLVKQSRSRGPSISNQISGDGHQPQPHRLSQLPPSRDGASTMGGITAQMRGASIEQKETSAGPGMKRVTSPQGSQGDAFVGSGARRISGLQHETLAGPGVQRMTSPQPIERVSTHSQVTSSAV